MLLEASKRMNIELSKSWMIGDRASDVVAGRKAGAKGICIRTGYGELEINLIGRDSLTQESIVEAVDFVIVSCTG